jgi:hypothetical protein
MTSLAQRHQIGIEFGVDPFVTEMVEFDSISGLAPNTLAGVRGVIRVPSSQPTIGLDVGGIVERSGH